AVKWFRSGASASSRTVSQDWKNMLGRVAPGLFPPDLVVQVKALACELPTKYDRPLSRWSTTDLVQHVQQSGLVASVSGSTLWRWLHEAGIRPGYHRSGVSPRAPGFAGRAGRIVDLYARRWQGSVLKEDEFVISARKDEHSGAPPQACHAELPATHSDACRTRVLSLRRLDLHRRTGCAPRQNLRTLRIEEWHRTLRPIGGTGDDQTALQ